MEDWRCAPYLRHGIRLLILCQSCKTDKTKKSQAITNSLNMYRQITPDTFRQDVLTSKSLVLVQFKTEWSGVCQIMAPIFKELANGYRGMADFFSIDVEQGKGIEHDYGITEIPTILFFRNGMVVEYAAGLVPRNILIHKIEHILSASRP